MTSFPSADIDFVTSLGRSCFRFVLYEDEDKKREIDVKKGVEEGRKKEKRLFLLFLSSPRDPLPGTWRRRWRPRASQR